MKKMKIGIDCREFLHGKMTGIGRVIRNFIDSASSLKPNWQFVLFANQYTKISIPYGKNINVRVINEYITQIWDQIQLPYFLEKERCNLFLSPYYKKPLFTRLPCVIIIHDLIPLLMTRILKSFPLYDDELRTGEVWGKHWLKLLMRLYAASALKIITPSYTSKNDIVKLLGIPENKVEVVYWGIDPQFYPCANFEYLQSKYKISKPYILYVGNFKQHKNIDRLVFAFFSVPDNIRKKYQLLLVGDKYYGKTDDAIMNINYISTEDLRILYSSAEIFVFPSLYEGFGFPPLEAMACGCPVVSSNTSSMPEILGDACLYFNPHDVRDISNKISEVLQNKTLADELKQKGLDRAKIFSPEKMTKKLLNVLLVI